MISKSIYNLKLIKDKLSALPPPVLRRGTGAGAGRARNVLSVKALPTPSRYQVNFSGLLVRFNVIYRPHIGVKVLRNGNAGKR